ncbi:MAG: flagellar biosynthesis protein FliR, partial [Candidatus Endobugula sp.]
MEVKLSPRKVLIFLSSIIGVLLIANTIGIILNHLWREARITSVMYLFDFNSERNVPTLYSSCALLLSAALLFLIGVIHKKKHESY